LASTSTSLVAKNVLVIDPDEAFGDVLEEVLGPSGYMINQVLHPQAALTAIGCHATDVVLLNVDCGKNGQQAHRDFVRALTEFPAAPPSSFLGGKSTRRRYWSFFKTV
jgi:CheY-like chemotaxis protein